MNLAKPRIDIGFATNNAPAALAFWQNEIGLPFDHTQPIRRGYKQHRHDLCGSILKINQVYEPLPDSPPSGYRELLIARDGVNAPKPMIDPDGNRVSLLPRGMFGIERIGVRIGVRDVEAHRRFYTEALGLAQGEAAGGAMTFLAGDTVLIVEAAPDAPHDASFEGKGWRYITFQCSGSIASTLMCWPMAAAKPARRCRSAQPPGSRWCAIPTAIGSNCRSAPRSPARWSRRRRRTPPSSY
jgi:catechol 2,3-dioxygenase-like lactoylglutathione lyase family enzyme